LIADFRATGAAARKLEAQELRRHPLVRRRARPVPAARYGGRAHERSTRCGDHELRSRRHVEARRATFDRSRNRSGSTGLFGVV